MYHVMNVSIVKNATNDIIRILSMKRGTLSTCISRAHFKVC